MTSNCFLSQVPYQAIFFLQDSFPILTFSLFASFAISLGQTMSLNNPDGSSVSSENSNHVQLQRIYRQNMYIRNE